jgi:hypothetical protein
MKVIPIKIYLERRLDSLRNNWFEWTCTAELSNGNSAEGTVQADGQGELIAEETFEESV